MQQAVEPPGGHHDVVVQQQHVLPGGGSDALVDACGESAVLGIGDQLRAGHGAEVIDGPVAGRVIHEDQLDRLVGVAQDALDAEPGVLQLVVGEDDDRREAPVGRFAGCGLDEVLDDVELPGLVAGHSADLQAAGAELPRPAASLPLVVVRVGDRLNAAEPVAGAVEELLDFAAGEEPQVAAVQQSGRLVGPVAGQEAADHRVVPDVGDAGHHASARGKPRARLAQELLGPLEVFQHVPADDAVEMPFFKR